MIIEPNDPFTLIQLIGTIAFAVSGGAVAVRAGMDWLGVIVLALVTAVGGGTLREVVTGQLPVAWVTSSWPLWVAMVSGIAVIVLGHRVPHLALDSWTAVLIGDAAGLAVFTVAGTMTSLQLGISGPVSMMLGVVTGAGGGVLRDVLAKRRPLVLVGQIYALAAVAGAAAVVVLHAVDLTSWIVRWVGIAIILVLRLAAIRWEWSLPNFGRSDD